MVYVHAVEPLLLRRRDVGGPSVRGNFLLAQCKKANNCRSTSGDCLLLLTVQPLVFLRLFVPSLLPGLRGRGDKGGRAGRMKEHVEVSFCNAHHNRLLQALPVHAAHVALPPPPILYLVHTQDNPKLTSNLGLIHTPISA